MFRFPDVRSLFGLREKLALGFAALLAVVLALGLFSMRHLERFRSELETTVNQPYEQFRTATDMKLAIENMRETGLLYLLGLDEQGAQRARHAEVRFETSVAEAAELPNGGAFHNRVATMEEQFHQLTSLHRQLMRDKSIEAQERQRVVSQMSDVYRASLEEFDRLSSAIRADLMTRNNALQEEMRQAQ